VGLDAVVAVGFAVAGPAWVWVLPVALGEQCLLLAVYLELSAEFPLTGGPYQWSRRLMGGAYGWFNGWVAICAYTFANTTIAFLGAAWALTLLGITPTAEAIVLTGYQVWATPLLALIGVTGFAYLLVARPHRKLAPQAAPADTPVRV
jgi:amino acid transporter